VALQQHLVDAGRYAAAAFNTSAAVENHQIRISMLGTLAVKILQDELGRASFQ
jgi:hypothetical protein